MGDAKCLISSHYSRFQSSLVMFNVDDGNVAYDSITLLFWGQRRLDYAWGNPRNVII